MLLALRRASLASKTVAAHLVHTSAGALCQLQQVSQPFWQQQFQVPQTALLDSAWQAQAQNQQQKQQDDADPQQQQQQQAGREGGPEEEAEQPLEGPNGLLAEWRVESMRWYSQVFHMVVDTSLNYPQFCTWAELYQSAPPGLLRRLLVPEGASNLTWPLSRMYFRHSLISEFLLSQAHADFDTDNFKEGVKQALEFSIGLYAASDFVGLKPLVSTALLQSMRHAREQQAELMDADDAVVSGVELVINLDSVQLVSASALTREQLAGLDQQRANAELPLIPVAADNEDSGTVDAGASAAAAAASGGAAAATPVAEGAADQAAWDLAHVYAEGVLHTQVAKGGGQARDVSLLKKGHFVLARGPVHIDRVLSADEADKTPWFLLAWL